MCTASQRRRPKVYHHERKTQQSTAFGPPPPPGPRANKKRNHSLTEETSLTRACARAAHRATTLTGDPTDAATVTALCAGLGQCFDPAVDNVAKSLRQGPFLRFCAAYDAPPKADV
jgi:hypothetical protein